MNKTEQNVPDPTPAPHATPIPAPVASPVDTPIGLPIALPIALPVALAVASPVVRENRIAEEQNTVPIKEGSPAKKPCSHIGLRGTANEQSAATKINSPAGARTPIRAGPVPLFLVPKTISTEIHAHGEEISEITVRRARHHLYAISLIKTAPKGQKEKNGQKGQKAGGADAD